MSVITQPEASVISLADWRVRLRGSSTHEGQERAVREVSGEAIVVDAAVDDADVGRYAWLEVEMPDGTSVSALGELARRDPLQLALEVRFKHLFPDHKARLLSALALQA